MREYIKWSIFTSIIGIILGFAITKMFSYELKDVLFAEGIMFIIAGILSSISGNSKGLSLQGLGSQNAQYVANANLEITKKEKEQKNNRQEISLAFSNVALIVAGIVCIVINYII